MASNDVLKNNSHLLAKSFNQPTYQTVQQALKTISDVKIQNFCEQLKNQAKIIYLTYFKPIDITVTVTSSTVENESHD